MESTPDKTPPHHAGFSAKNAAERLQTTRDLQVKNWPKNRARFSAAALFQ
jgi:hypothetical protein